MTPILTRAAAKQLLSFSHDIVKDNEQKLRATDVFIKDTDMSEIQV